MILFSIKLLTPLGKGDIIRGVLHLHHSSVAFYSIVLSTIAVYSLGAFSDRLAYPAFLLWILFDVLVCLPWLINGIVVFRNGIAQIVFLRP